MGSVQDSSALQATLPSPTASALQAVQLPAWTAAVSLLPVRLRPELVIVDASWQRYSLPLQKPLTTGAELRHRDGFLLRLTAEPEGRAEQRQVTAGHAALNGSTPSAVGSVVIGVGEVCCLSVSPNVFHASLHALLYKP